MTLFRLVALIAFTLALVTTTQAAWRPQNDADCSAQSSEVDTCYFKCAAYIGWGLGQDYMRDNNAPCSGGDPPFAPAPYKSCLEMKYELERYCYYRQTILGYPWALKPLYKYRPKICRYC